MTQNTDINTTSINEEKSSLINLRDLFAISLAHWYWFVISLAITLGLATFYILRTAPVYTRTTSILVKNDDDSSNPLSKANMSQFGLLGSNLTIQNEILTLKSISLMEDVVRRLNLQNSYSARKGLRKMDMYKANPVEITLLDSAILTHSVQLEYEMHPDGKITLSDFKLDKDNLSGEVTIPVGQSVKTPVGRILTAKTPWFNEEMIGETYNFRHVTPLAAAKTFSSAIVPELGNEDATIINISYSGSSIPKANDILRTLVDVYNEQWIEDKNQVAVSTYNFINDRLAVIEQELGEVDSDISSYKSQNLLPDINEASHLYLQQSSQNQIEIMQINNQLYMAKFLLKEMNAGNITSPLPANTGIGSTSLEAQIGEYNKMVLERNRLIAGSSESNPLVTELTSSLKAFRTNIAVGLDNTITGLNNQLRALQGQEAKATGHLAASPNQARYLLSVERQQKVKESLYLFLLEKREESQLSQAFTAYNTRLIDAPFGSSLPSSPKKSFIFASAFIIGLLIPFGILFIRETLNTKVRGKRDVEDLSIPIMGEIPQIFDEHHHEKKIFQKKKRRTNKGIKDIVVRAGSRNVINEAFRVLRTNLEFMNGKNETGQVVMITSFNPGSGKSLITMNLAITLGLNGKKVIVVDGDLRRASSSAYVDNPKKGLSNYLTGSINDYHNVIVQLGKGNVDVIPVGTMPPNPSELLAQPKMMEMIEQLKTQYDYILLDCPPVDIVADTAVLASVANRTIFVVRVGLLDRSMLPELQNLYKEGRFNNMALILNCVPVTSGRYGYRYGYKYGHYGYGYGYGYGRYGYGHYGHYGHYGYYHSDDDIEDEDDDNESKSNDKK